MRVTGYGPLVDKGDLALPEEFGYEIISRQGMTQSDGTITLIFESTDLTVLENPDNVVIVPTTGDILLQEDSEGEQFVRGLTLDGEIHDFARSIANSTGFAGGTFSPDGQTLYVNQQGDRGPGRPEAVTYAIYGPFQRRRGPLPRLG